MSYLIVQIWIFLLIALLIGLIAGLLLRRGSGEKLDKANQEWSQRFANLEAERDEIASKHDRLSDAGIRQGEMFLKLSEERDVLSRRLAERESGKESETGQTIIDYKQRLAQHEVEAGQLKDQLSETASQLTATQQRLQAVRGDAKDDSAPLQNGSEQLDSLAVKLSESDKLLAERDQTIEQLHQKLAKNLTDHNETKDSLSLALNEEREKVNVATVALEEEKRLKAEYEEQLKSSENSLQGISSELKQKQEFFEVNRRELDTKLKNSGAQFESVNLTIREQDERLKQLQQAVEERDLSLKTLGTKESELQNTVNRMSQQLEQTQKSLTESNQRQQRTEDELRASKLHIAKIQDQNEEPQPARDYSGVASGIMAGAAGATVASKSDGLSTGWSKLSGLARDGYHKVKVKVEDTTNEVVNTTAKATPDEDSYRVEIIRSIGTDNRRLLHEMGVNTTSNLLDKCRDPEGVKLISKTLGRESWVVSSWVSIADLLRIKGIDGGTAEVLELSGVYSVQSLAEANPEKLLQSIKAVNERVEKVGIVPDIAIIAGWIRQAGAIEKLIA